MALVYATSPRGACHNQSDYFLVEIGQIINSLGMEQYPRQGGAEKARNVSIHQNWRTITNSLGACFFANVPPESILELVNTACGLDWTLEKLLLAGERGWNLKRVINIRLGLNRTNDKLPKGLLRPYSDHPLAAEEFVPDFTEMLDAYYQVRGWDKITGYPTREKLVSTGIRLAGGGYMVKLFSVTEMKAVENEANQSGLTYESMMENAGRGIGTIIDNAYSHITP